MRALIGVFYWLTLMLTGSRRLRADAARPPSIAEPEPETTRLGQWIGQAASGRSGPNGFRLLATGSDAFLARAALADIAERTLDVQYYIYSRDRSGISLLQRLLRAADRGVRVRLLLDDNNLAGSELSLAELHAHPNLDIRIFNPFAERNRRTRILQGLLEFARLTRRMHNKLFAADNAFAIVGGRNIADEYFDVARTSNFHDYDLLFAGPLVREASASFDHFWNSPWAVPATALLSSEARVPDADRVRRQVDAFLAGRTGFAPRYQDAVREFSDHVLLDPDGYGWARGEVIWEPAGKGASAPGPGDLPPVVRRLGQLWDATREEALIEVAYFIPGAQGLRRLRRMCRRGVRVRALTNSLANHDVPLAHGGYTRYRAPLLRAGVELHEFRPDPATRRPKRWLRPRGSRAALHSKVMVLDRRWVWVGSFNLDPRSAMINTEIAVVVDCPEFAATAAAALEDDFAPERSWQVRLDREGRLAWHGVEAGRTAVRTREPEADLGRRLLAWLGRRLGRFERQL